MKVLLMHPVQDFDSQPVLPENEADLSQDLELGTLLDAMATGDSRVWNVAKAAIFSGLSMDATTILYRQEILKDCLNHPAVIRRMYGLVVTTIEKERKNFWGIFRDYPSAILHRSVDVMQMFLENLRELRSLADEQAPRFHSGGFLRFFDMLRAELGDDYLAMIEDHLKRLRFRDGVLVSAGLGRGNKAINYVLRKLAEQRWTWWDRLHSLFRRPTDVYTLHIHPRDENGAKALSELRDQGLNLVANALAQSTDHILNFLKALRTELAFYVGCLNLRDRLTCAGGAVCFPKPMATDHHSHFARGLYDVCLALKTRKRVVGNDLTADNTDLIVITGANQGGKSTFLRGIGLAQLLMQAGMFVPAGEFSANLCDRLFTHYKREEDVAMKSGKLDEEFVRMSWIVDRLTPDSLLLFNESFAATNEREGSEIARQILCVLTEKRLKSFVVTHLYEFANGMFEEHRENVLFLRAERENNGRRTFKILPGEPLETSFGVDLYQEIFGDGFALDRSRTRISLNSGNGVCLPHRGKTARNVSELMTPVTGQEPAQEYFMDQHEGKCGTERNIQSSGAICTGDKPSIVPSSERKTV